MKRAFTLVELLVVISIISLLSSVVIAGVSEAREKARIASLLTLSQSVYSALGDHVLFDYRFDDQIHGVATDSFGTKDGVVTALGGGDWTGEEYSNDAPSGSSHALRHDKIITIANAPITSDGLTFETFIKVTPWVWSSAQIFNWGGNLVFSYENGTLCVRSLNGGVAEQICTIKTFNDLKWHHIIYTIGPNVPQKIYADGVQQTVTINGSGSFTEGTYESINFYNGNLIMGQREYFLIDDTRVFNAPYQW